MSVRSDFRLSVLPKGFPFIGDFSSVGSEWGVRNLITIRLRGRFGRWFGNGFGNGFGTGFNSPFCWVFMTVSLSTYLWQETTGEKGGVTSPLRSVSSTANFETGWGRIVYIIERVDSSLRQQGLTKDSRGSSFKYCHRPDGFFVTGTLVKFPLHFFCSFKGFLLKGIWSQWGTLVIPSSCNSYLFSPL